MPDGAEMSHEARQQIDTKMDQGFCFFEGGSSSDSFLEIDLSSAFLPEEFRPGLAGAQALLRGVQGQAPGREQMSSRNRSQHSRYSRSPPHSAAQGIAHPELNPGEQLLKRLKEGSEKLSASRCAQQKLQSKGKKGERREKEGGRKGERRGKRRGREGGKRGERKGK